MKASVEHLPGHRARLDIEVDAERMDEALDRAFRRIRQQVQIPGFRKGRAPRPLVERHVGAELLQREALEEVVPEAYYEAVSSTEIEPVDSPDFDLQDIEDGQPFRFSAEVTIKPEVELPDLEDLVVEYEQIDDSEERVGEHVAQELERLQEQHATLETVDRALEDGLYAIIDCRGYAHDKHYEALSGEGITVGIGTGGFLPGFDRQLIGAGAGDERVVELVLPEELEDEELAGADARFEVTVQSVKERVLPELNDEFAAEVSEEESLDDLRNAIREAVEEALANQKQQSQRQAAVAALVEAAEPDIPEAMIRNRVEELMRETEQQFEGQNLSFEDYLAQTGRTREEVTVEMRPRAHREVSAELVLDALCKQQELDASDEELDEELAQLGQQVGQSAQALRNFVLQDHHLQEIRATVGRQKAAEYLLEKVTLKAVEPQEHDHDHEHGEHEGHHHGHEHGTQPDAPPEGASDQGREDLWVPGSAEQGRQGLWVPGHEDEK